MAPAYLRQSVGRNDGNRELCTWTSPALVAMPGRVIQSEWRGRPRRPLGYNPADSRCLGFLNRPKESLVGGACRLPISAKEIARGIKPQIHDHR